MLTFDKLHLKYSIHEKYVSSLVIKEMIHVDIDSKKVVGKLPINFIHLVRIRNGISPNPFR